MSRAEKLSGFFRNDIMQKIPRKDLTRFVLRQYNGSRLTAHGSRLTAHGHNFALITEEDNSSVPSCLGQSFFARVIPGVKLS